MRRSRGFAQWLALGSLELQALWNRLRGVTRAHGAGRAGERSHDQSARALAEACEIPSHMASEHLRLMHRCGFLDVEKHGRCVYYTIAEPHLANIMACIESRFDTRA